MIIPSYKRPDFLKDCIESVVRQTFQNWELIVVDDNGAGSAAQVETEKLMLPYITDRRFQYIVLPENKGGSAARNVGWKKSKAKYICFLDNDDQFYPQKLENQYQMLEKSTYRATVCRFESFKKDKLVRTSPLIIFERDYLISVSKGHVNFGAGSTLMIERSLLDELQGFDEDFRRKQDVEFIIRLLCKAPLLVSNEILVKLRIDDRSNIPKLEKFKSFQSMFRNKFGELFDTFSQKDQREIRQYELTELAKVSLWNKEFYEFCKIMAYSELSLAHRVKLFGDLARKFVTYYFR